MLDITGCAHLFGGEAALGARPGGAPGAPGCSIARRGRRHGRLRLGIARYADLPPSPGAGARVRKPRESTIIPREQRGRDAAAAGRGVAHRRRDRGRADHQAGLKRIADLAGRPRAPLAARFGEALLRRLDQALGRDDEPITPRLPLPAAMAERRFAEPIALAADVLGTIEQLARELGRVLERRGEGARLVAGRAVSHRRQGASARDRHRRAAARSRAHAASCSRTGLRCWATPAIPGFGYDMVRLSALVTERCDPTADRPCAAAITPRRWRI